MKFKVLLSGRKQLGDGKFSFGRSGAIFTVKTKEQTLLFERGNQSSKPKWLMRKTPAWRCRYEFASEGEERSRYSSPSCSTQEYGLDQPQATDKAENQTTHQLILGKPDFNRNFLYAQADPLLNQLGM